MLWKRPKILVADDDYEMRRVVVDSLSKEAYDILEAADGGELLASIERMSSNDPIDLMVTDIRMPICGGLDAVRGFRALDQVTPIIVMSAFGSPQIRDDANILGAAFLDKPFPMGELRALVRDLLGLRRRW